MKDDDRQRLPRTSEPHEDGGGRKSIRRARGWTRVLFGQIGEMWGLARKDARARRKETREARKELCEALKEPPEEKRPARRLGKPLFRRWHAYVLALAFGLLLATAQQSYNLLGSLSRGLSGQNGPLPVKKEGSLAPAKRELLAGQGQAVGAAGQKSGPKAADSSRAAVGRLKQGVQKELGNEPEANSHQGAVTPQEPAVPVASTGGPVAARAGTAPATPAKAPQSTSPQPKVSQPADRFGNLAWPVRGDTIVSFGWKKHPVFGDWRFHDGLDLAVPAGTPVVAAFSGTVVEASWMPVPYHSKADAYTVIIEHGGGWRSTYGLLSQVLVARGSRVSRGTVIGRAGVITGGEGTGEAVLHFALAKDEAPVDPKTWLP